MSLPNSDVDRLSKQIGLSNRLSNGEKSKEIAYIVLIENGHGSASKQLKKLFKFRKKGGDKSAKQFSPQIYSNECFDRMRKSHTMMRLLV